MARGHNIDVKLLMQRVQRFKGTIYHRDLSITVSHSSHSIDK